MKYGILIAILLVTAQLFGQSARMGAGAMQSYAVYQTGDHGVALNTNIGVTQVVPASESASLLVPAYRGAFVSSSCDVVVQEELVAGRMASNGHQVGGFHLLMMKLKNLFHLHKVR